MLAVFGVCSQLHSSLLLSAFPRCALAPHFCCTAGKGKRPLDDSDAAAAHERPCLEVLLGMPSRTVSRRSEGHMVQSLEVSGGAPQVLGTQRQAE